MKHAIEVVIALVDMLSAAVLGLCVFIGGGAYLVRFWQEASDDFPVCVEMRRGEREAR